MSLNSNHNFLYESDEETQMFFNLRPQMIQTQSPIAPSPPPLFSPLLSPISIGRLSPVMIIPQQSTSSLPPLPISIGRISPVMIMTQQPTSSLPPPSISITSSSSSQFEKEYKEILEMKQREVKSLSSNWDRFQLQRRQIEEKRRKLDEEERELNKRIKMYIEKKKKEVHDANHTPLTSFSKTYKCNICFNLVCGLNLMLLSCSHYFCSDCLDNWKKTQQENGHEEETCPECRQEINVYHKVQQQGDRFSIKIVSIDEPIEVIGSDDE